MPNRRAHDHLTDHNWQLEIEGVTAGYFDSVEGLSESSGKVSRLETKSSDSSSKGGAQLKPGIVVKVPAAPLKWQPRDLKRPVTSDPGGAVQSFPTMDPGPSKTIIGGFKSVSGMDSSAGVTQGAFKNVEGLDAETELNARPRTAARLTIRGLVPDSENGHLLQGWLDPRGRRSATRGQIVMVDGNGNPLQRWNFFEAWPCKWYPADRRGGACVELTVGRLAKA